MCHPDAPPAAPPLRDLNRPVQVQQPSRRRATTPPPSNRSREPAPAPAEALRVGSRAQGNWRAQGYWHPCTVVALLPGGAFRLEYDDGHMEDAPAEMVLPMGQAAAANGGFGAAAVGRGEGGRGGGCTNFESDSEKWVVKKATPLAPRRRRASGVQDAEKVRKQFEQERKARLEVVKLKAEDRRWAEAHGLSGDRGLFQGMIVRYRSSMTPPTSLPAVSSSAPITVFVRKRPVLADEAKAGAFDVVTPAAAEVSTSLVMHEPKTLVDLSKAMDNHT